MGDKVVRATAEGAFIRAFAADTREMVETARALHNSSPVVTAALGRTMTAAAMMSYMQKSENERLTIKISGDGPIGSIVVTGDGNGRIKGFAANPDVDIPLKPSGKLDVSGAVGQGFLSVIKDMQLKEPYVGEVQLQTGEIAEDLTYYFLSSEQVPSAVGLGVLVDTDLSVKCAGGFIIQLMPFAPDEFIDRLEENLKKISPVTVMLEKGMTPKDILLEVLDGLDTEFTDEYEPVFFCDCNRDKVTDALKLISKDEIKDMIDEGKDVNVHCDFCNKDYTYTVDQLMTLL